MVIRSTLDVTGLLAAVRPTLARLAAEVAPRPAEASAADEPLDTTGSPASTQAVAVDARRAVVLRRALEEWGVRCREHAGLAALDAFGVISARGVEVGVAAELPPAGRALAYARGVARLLMHDDRQFATWFDYRPGFAPHHLTPLERRTTAVVDGVARALLHGRLEAAPRCAFKREGDGPDDESGPSPSRSRFLRAVAGAKKVCAARLSAATEFVLLAYFLLLQIGEFIPSVFAKDMDDLKLVKVIPVVLFIRKTFAPRFGIARKSASDFLEFRFSFSDERLSALIRPLSRDEYFRA